MLKEFYTAIGNRPVRLSDETRKLALRALDCEFGLQLAEKPYVDMNEVEGFENMSDLQKYSAMINKIVNEIPLRIISPYIVGSASMDAARQHQIPAYFNGQSVYSSVSHITPGFYYVLEIGYKGVRDNIRDRLKSASDEDKEYLLYLLGCLNAADIYHKRYLDFLKQKISNETDDNAREILEDTYNNLKNVPENPPKNFKEAIQSLWFMFAFLRACGNWPGIGRIDMMLGKYLENDMASGIITEDEAREYIAHFFIMGCEWITGFFEWQSGDAQHYQNIVLGGVDDNGVPVANTVTRLVLEVIEELSISDFPIAVRLNHSTPDWLYRKIAQVARHGGGVVAVYNDDVCIKALENAGYDHSQAIRYANDGCWEIQVPGETNFAYHPTDILTIFNRDVLHSLDEKDAPIPEYNSIDEIFDAFEKAFDNWRNDYYNNIKWPTHQGIPTGVIDLFTKGCVENARGYFYDGPNYVTQSIHAGAITDTANSIYAINKMVFEDKIITLPELVKAMRENFENYEDIRAYAKNKIVYFGNDDDEADSYFVRLYNLFVDRVSQRKRVDNIIVTPGISTFGRETNWRNDHGATAFGAKCGDVLSANIAPTPGTDFKGATAVINSACKADYTKLSGSTAAHIRVMPSSVEGDDGIDAIISLIKGFKAQGGFFMQMDVVDNEELKKAQNDPDNYRNLSVRVSGWSARFVTLNKVWQNMIINKNSQGV